MKKYELELISLIHYEAIKLFNERQSEGWTLAGHISSKILSTNMNEPYLQIPIKRRIK